MAEWLKARVCKTLGVTSRVSSNLTRTFKQESVMKKLNAEIVKNIIATIIAFGTLLILALAIVSGSQKKNTELQGGDIEHAIQTEQYR